MKIFRTMIILLIALLPLGCDLINTIGCALEGTGQVRIHNQSQNHTYEVYLDGEFRGTLKPNESLYYYVEAYIEHSVKWSCLCFPHVSECGYNRILISTCDSITCVCSD